MIAFRQVPPNRPFAAHRRDQRPGRWHGEGEGPATYLASTPDAAWAEFLRHEGITDPVDLEGVDRWLWAVQIDEPFAFGEPTLEPRHLDGGPETYPICQAEARRLRALGFDTLVAPSAAVVESPSGFTDDAVLTPGPVLRERTIVLFGTGYGVLGWIAAGPGRPDPTLLTRVRQI